MNKKLTPKPLSWWRHKESGNEYQVLLITNEGCSKEGFQPTVVYVDTKGKPYSKPVSEWSEKFDYVESAHLNISSSNIADIVCMAGMASEGNSINVRSVCNQFQRIIESLEEKGCVPYRPKGTSLSRVGSEDKDWTLGLGSLLMPKTFITGDSIARVVELAQAEIDKSANAVQSGETFEVAKNECQAL